MKLNEKVSEKIKYILICIWLLFTVSLTVWWIYFGLSQLNDLETFAATSPTNIVRYHKMLLWEGATLILFLIIGAVTLIVFVMKERSERKLLRDFFVAFSHELKTPLSSLRLHADVLQEKLKGGEHREIISRLINDTNRLARHLENSLFLGGKDTELLLEVVSLSDTIRSLKEEWRDISVKCAGEATIKADSRALSAVFGNLFSNAVLHGNAANIEISAEPRGASDQIVVTVKDDGKGFLGDTRQLGEPFIRHYSKSGSGLGLYIVRMLMQKMGGKAIFRGADRGFSVELYFHGALRG